MFRGIKATRLSQEVPNETLQRSVRRIRTGAG